MLETLGAKPELTDEIVSGLSDATESFKQTFQA